MKRRAFLKAALAGTVGAFVGGLPRALTEACDDRQTSTILDFINQRGPFAKPIGPKRSRWVASSSTIKFTSSDGKTFTMEAEPGSLEIHLDKPTYEGPALDIEDVEFVMEGEWPVQS